MGYDRVVQAVRPKPGSRPAPLPSPLTLLPSSLAVFARPLRSLSSLAIFACRLRSPKVASLKSQSLPVEGVEHLDGDEDGERHGRRRLRHLVREDLAARGEAALQEAALPVLAVVEVALRAKNTPRKDAVSCRAPPNEGHGCFCIHVRARRR